MNICVVGSGYVGLVTGAVFADLGNDVVCVDNDRAKIDCLRAGQMPIYEPGLEEMVTRNMQDGRLAFGTDLAAAVRQSDVIFIAVGTPSKDSGETDLSQVEAVAAGGAPPATPPPLPPAPAPPPPPRRFPCGTGAPGTATRGARPPAPRPSRAGPSSTA